MTEVTTLASGECVLCEEPFAYRADRGQRNICDGCMEFMGRAVRHDA